MTRQIHPRFGVDCAPCGGLPHFAGDRLLRSLATAWTGISAIHAGRIEIANRAAQCCISLLEQQPDDDKFYYKMTRDGRVVVDDSDPDNLIDVTKPKQAYWEVGLPMMLMCRMYQITHQTHFLDVAKRLFEFKLRCYTPTGEEWHICSFNAQPEAPAFFVAGPGQAGASGWALNESFSTGSGIRRQLRLGRQWQEQPRGRHLLPDYRRPAGSRRGPQFP